jgi:quercetin dioxygenase-like cupin family protein
MPFYSSDERERMQVFDGIMGRTFWGEKMLLSIVELEPHAVGPPHSHPHEKIGLVLEGELTFTIGDETRTLRPCDGNVVPGGVMHSVVAGDSPCKVVEIFSPVREDFQY